MKRSARSQLPASPAAISALRATAVSATRRRGVRRRKLPPGSPGSGGIVAALQELAGGSGAGRREKRNAKMPDAQRQSADPAKLAAQRAALARKIVQKTSR